MEDLVQRLSSWATNSPLQMGTLSVCLLSSGYIVYKTVHGVRAAKGRIYPPGPPKDPLIGNLRSLPMTEWYEKFCEWQGLYGDIVHVTLPGISMAIVNSLDVSHELLSKRADINSGRTIGYMIHDLMDYGWSAIVSQPGKAHTEIRKMLRSGIGPQRVASHDRLIEECTNDFILAVATLGGDPAIPVRNLMGRITIRIAYGEPIWEAFGEELVELNSEAAELLNNSFNTFWFADVFHFLRFIPTWFPGAHFKRVAARGREHSHRIRNWPWNQLFDLHKSGASGHCLGTDLLDQFGPTDHAKDTLAVLYLAGVDTTTSIITHFLHAMFMFPEIAQKVHEEILDCVGEERLPRLSDRVNLSYTEAVWKEALRWRPGIPIGIPHTSKEDQTFNGYFIPKGTIINPNFGFMLNDPNVWGDPKSFRPERFLRAHNPVVDSLPDPSHVIFGFGTRTCAGNLLADRVGFQVAVATMALYKILPLEGKQVPHPDTIRYAGNVIRLPIGFECRFVPCGPKAEDLLSSIAMDRKH